MLLPLFVPSSQREHELQVGAGEDLSLISGHVSSASDSLSVVGTGSSGNRLKSGDVTGNKRFSCARTGFAAFGSMFRATLLKRQGKLTM